METKVGNVTVATHGAEIKTTTPGTIAIVDYARDATLHFNLDSAIKPIASGESYAASLFAVAQDQPPERLGEALIASVSFSGEELEALAGAAQFLPAFRQALLTRAHEIVGTPPPPAP